MTVWMWMLDRSGYGKLRLISRTPRTRSQQRAVRPTPAGNPPKHLPS